MNTKLNSNGFWWTPGGDKLLGTLTFDKNQGGSLLVYGSFPENLENEKERFYYPLILGETEDGQELTLHNCRLKTSHPYMRTLIKSEVGIDTIFIGHHFQTESEMQFEKIRVVFSNIDKILSPMARPVSFNTRTQIMEIPVEDSCIIRIYARTTVLKRKQYPRTSLQVESDIEVTSLKESTFESYQELYNNILDFLNFYVNNDVDLVSVTGIYRKSGVKEEFTTSKEIDILYRYPSLIGQNKPVSNVIFYREQRYGLWIPHLLSKWFELQLSNRFEAVFNLYMGVMTSSPDFYLEFQLLALAQALEVYHSLAIGNESIYRKNRTDESEKIKKIIEENMPDKKQWIEAMLSNSVNPSIPERITEIFDRYQDFCYAYLKFNKKENLAPRIRDSRHYFTHWAENLKKKAMKDNDLYWLMKDAQFLLRLCLLSELGFDLHTLRVIFCVDEMTEIRRTRESEST